jgi:hypothetical protein
MTVTAETKGLRQGLGNVWARLVGDGHPPSPLTGRAALDWVRHGGPAGEGSAIDGASRTAIMTAQFRAAHALMDRDPIFEDRYALALADRSAADVMEFWRPASRTRARRWCACSWASVRGLPRRRSPAPSPTAWTGSPTACNRVTCGWLTPAVRIPAR